MIEKIAPYIDGIKLGLEFFYAQGQTGLWEISRFARDYNLPIFLDLKIHDIPTTVACSIAALVPPEPSLAPAILNIHAAGGLAMMRAARVAQRQYLPDTRLIGVTLLTSLAVQDLLSGTPQQHVRHFASQAQTAGLAGVVCSPHEIVDLRATYGEAFLLVVPGVRTDGQTAHDQKRVMSPLEACRNGADILILGRAITEATDPRAAAREIAEMITK